jgi:hypothetical protein
MSTTKRWKKILLKSAELDELTTTTTTTKTIQSQNQQRNEKTKRNEKNTQQRYNKNILQHHHQQQQQQQKQKQQQSYDINNNQEEQERKIKSKLTSILFIDHAFSKRSEPLHQSEKRKIQELHDSSTSRTKILKQSGNEVSRYEYSGSIVGNSRSSSSCYASKKKRHLPTFDKKKDGERKRIASLKDLANQLKTKQKKKKTLK